MSQEARIAALETDIDALAGDMLSYLESDIAARRPSYPTRAAETLLAKTLLKIIKRREDSNSAEK